MCYNVLFLVFLIPLYLFVVFLKESLYEKFSILGLFLMSFKINTIHQFFTFSSCIYIILRNLFWTVNDVLHDYNPPSKKTLQPSS